MRLLPLLALLAGASALPTQMMFDDNSIDAVAAHTSHLADARSDAAEVASKHKHKHGKTKPVFYKYPGKFGQDGWEFGYAQTVRVGDLVTTTGQGGWDPETGEVTNPTNQSAQIEQAFKNVDLALKTAGSEWKEVFHIRTFHIPVTDEAFETISVQFAHYLPKDVKPVLTAVGVTTLAIPGQLFEIDVEAWSPQ